MINLLKKVLKQKVKNKIDLLSKFYNHNQTVEIKKSINFQDEPIPWYTYPAINFIEQFDLSEKSVFEWGSGNSSFFFANKVKKIISVEHQKDWFDLIEPSKKNNQTIIFKNLFDYPNAINECDEKFDIIIIDGERRFDCSKNCLNKLNDNGLIILDNSDWFYKSASYLKNELNLIQVDFHGLGPINKYPWTTSFLFSREYNFKTLINRQPMKQYGSLNHDEMEIIQDEDKIYNTTNQEIVKKY